MSQKTWLAGTFLLAFLWLFVMAVLVVELTTSNASAAQQGGEPAGQELSVVLIDQWPSDRRLEG